MISLAVELQLQLHNVTRVSHDSHTDVTWLSLCSFMPLSVEYILYLVWHARPSQLTHVSEDSLVCQTNFVLCADTLPL